MNQTTTTIVVHIVAAFAENHAGGNLAGVVLDRADLSDAQMQEVAARVGLSETAFVRQVPGGFFLDFFTPAARVPDCGHATVAAFHVLDSQGRIESPDTVKYITTGSRPMRIIDGMVAMTQRFPTIGAVRAGLAQQLGFDANDLAGEPVVARHDVGFILVPVADRETLANFVPDFDAIRAVSLDLDVVGVYAFNLGNGVANPSTRMWAPAYGIPEESATGMAAGLLAAHLHVLHPDVDSFAVEQGALMKPPSPSTLRARIESAGDSRVVWVSGRAIITDVLPVTLD